MLAEGSIVVAHLVNPTEKAWGVLEKLDAAGIILRGINLSSFDDWLGELGKDEEPTLGLATTFAPLFRVERIFLDEQVGQVESYRQRLERTVGMSLESVLGLGESTEVPS